MENKDYITFGIALLGWSWAIIQFIWTIKTQRKDKALEKRFDIYSSFLNKMDEMNANMRNDPNMIYGIQSGYMSKLLNGTEEENNITLVEFNETLIQWTKKSVQPSMILNQELNSLKLVCSDKMLPLIEQYKIISNEYISDFQNALDQLGSEKDINKTAALLTKITHDERTQRMINTWKNIEDLMRKEIGYYKNKIASC